MPTKKRCNHWENQNGAAMQKMKNNTLIYSMSGSDTPEIYVPLRRVQSQSVTQKMHDEDEERTFSPSPSFCCD